jgi:hypothetical protein
MRRKLGQSDDDFSACKGGPLRGARSAAAANRDVFVQ